MHDKMGKAKRTLTLMGGAWLMGVGGVAEAATSAPRVAESAVSVVCVNGRAFADGPYREQVGQMIGAALQNLPKEAQRTLKDAGLWGAKVNWATISLGAVTTDDIRLETMPPLTMAVSVDHDIARVAAAMERGMREESGGRLSVVQTVIEDVPAWEIVQEGEALVGVTAGKRPCFASLGDGQILLAANLGTALAEQIRLYRSGDGCARKGLGATAGLKKSMVARVATRDLGSLVARFMPEKIMEGMRRDEQFPNLVSMLTNLRTGVGSLDLSSDGRELELSLVVDAASAEDAQSLRKLLTMMDQESRQHFNDAQAEKASDRLAYAILSRGVTIAGTGARIQLVAHIPLASVVALQDERRVKEAAADASDRLQVEARKVFEALEAEGWPTATGGQIPESVRPLLKDWHVAVNVPDDVGDRVPVLVSSNLDPSQLLGAWDGRTDSDVALSLRAEASPASGAAWRDSMVVAVTKSGRPQVIKKKYLKYSVLYMMQAFECPEGFAYATADGIVKPVRKGAARRPARVATPVRQAMPAQTATTVQRRAVSPTVRRTTPASTSRRTTTTPTEAAVDTLLCVVPAQPAAVIRNIGDTATRGLRNLFSR